MPTFPIFHCKVCNSAVQLESTALKNYFPSSGSSSASLYSSELDSGDFTNYCRGQGNFYTSSPRDKYSSPIGGGGDDDHFNFSGCFQGMCCYCALGGGLSLGSFGTLSCHYCLQRFHTVREFSKLKIRVNDDDADDDDGDEAAATTTTTAISTSGCTKEEEDEVKMKKQSLLWNRQGWAGLSDSLIDHILQLALGENVELVR